MQLVTTPTVCTESQEKHRLTPAHRTCYSLEMDEDAFRQFVLDLSGPARDRTHLARLLGISEATAYGWIRLSQEGTFSRTTSVRGEANKRALRALNEGFAEYEDGVPLERVSSRLAEFVSDGPPRFDEPHEPGEESEPFRRSSIMRGIQYAMRRLQEGADIDEVLASLETVIAMNRELGMK